MNNAIMKEIMYTIKQGDFNGFKKLIEDNPDSLNIMTPFGTWLHVATRQGQLEMVKYLVQKGVDINKRGGVFDGSAINLAAAYGKIEIVKYLISKGAILDVSLARRNPLFNAIQGGHIDIVKYLIEKGIDIKATYEIGSLENVGAYEFAVEFGQLEIADYIKEKLN